MKNKKALSEEVIKVILWIIFILIGVGVVYALAKYLAGSA